MFPHILTVLNRDYNRGYLESPLRTVGIRGDIPTFAVLDLGFRVIVLLPACPAALESHFSRQWYRHTGLGFRVV